MTGSVLIEAAELATLIGSGLVLADVRWTLGGPSGRADFELGHLPGAQWVDLDQELSDRPGVGGRHPLPRPEVFTAAMQRIGVFDTLPVVAYDAASSLAASRLWWLLTDAGHPRVRVLDGGLAAWVAAGYDVATGAPVEVPPGRFVGRPGGRSRLDAAEIQRRTAAGAAIELVDVRATVRYTGASEPLDPVAGHIPGAVSLPSTDHLDETGRFRSTPELGRQFAGLTEPVFYCGSGITAAHSLLALEAAGGTGSIYPGSWSDWVSDPDRPVATGATP